MKYKLLVLDLDGTLTNSQKEITPFTKEVLINPHCATSRTRLLIIIVNRSFQSIVFPEYG